MQGVNLNWQADFWNREGPGKEYHFPVDFEQLDRLLEANRSARILEFGCGYGRVAVALHRRGYAVEGVDPSAPMIELARERCSSLKPPPRFASSPLPDCRTKTKLSTPRSWSRC